jgi:hypothetical protein
MRAKVTRKELHHRAMKDTNHYLEHSQQLQRSERPTVPQYDVVLFLDSDSGDLSQHVQPIGKFLKLNQLDLPGPILLGNNRL